MNKILISIKPKWVAKILNGEKTLEIRKTAPKCELPCEVYIYCTKNEYLYRTNKGYFASKKPLRVGKGTEYTFAYSDEGMVVAKFTLNKIVPIVMQHGGLGDMGYGYCAHEDFEWYWNIEDKTCVSYDELKKYFNGKDGYAWHIHNLKIFDKPKELKDYGVKCSPQSYCYCEVEE